MQKIVTPYHKSDAPKRMSGRVPDKRLRGRLRHLSGLITPLFVLGLWQFVTANGLIDHFIVPPPADVAAKLMDVLADGTLWFHTRTTMVEVILGLAVGLLIGTSLGYAIAKNDLLEDLLTPVIVTFQSTPIVAYAPLLVIWFGSGLESKIVTSTLIVFFPMLMNTIVGIRSVPPELRDLMKVSQATWWQTFTRL
jgi:NitT/TauT family transport system permease protein